MPHSGFEDKWEGYEELWRFRKSIAAVQVRDGQPFTRLWRGNVSTTGDLRAPGGQNQSNWTHTGWGGRGNMTKRKTSGYSLIKLHAERQRGEAEGPPSGWRHSGDTKGNIPGDSILAQNSNTYWTFVIHRTFLGKHYSRDAFQNLFPIFILIQRSKMFKFVRDYKILLHISNVSFENYSNHNTF